MRATPLITDCLDRHSQHCPDKPAYLFLSEGLQVERQLTFVQLRTAARHFAGQLLSRARPGDRALLILPPGLDFIVAFFACLYAGVVAVPLCPPNKRRSQRTLQGIAEDCSARLVVTVKVLGDALEGQGPREGLVWLAMDSQDLPEPVPLCVPAADPHTLAFIQYTSGSTSAPKGVMVSHGNIAANQAMICQAFGHNPDSTVVGWVPHYHDQGLIGNILQPMFVGATSVLMSPVTFMRWPLRWLQAISRYRAHSSGGPNFAFAACIKALAREPDIELDLRSWQVAFNGAEPIQAETLNAFQAAFQRHGLRREAIYPCYGLAECTLQACGNEKGRGPVTLTVDPEALRDGRILLASRGQTLVSSGRAMAGSQVAIVDPGSGNALAACTIGEVWISGPHVAQGYWNQPALSAQAFCNPLSGAIQAPYLRTGDLGFIHQGELYVTGRMKDVMIIRGKNYYPHDIEHSVSAAHQSLEDSACAVFAVAGSEEKVIVVQEVRREWRKKIVLDEVISIIRQAVVSHNDITPHDIVLLMPGKLLKTSSGKVMRSAMRTQYLDQTLERLQG